MAKYFKPKEFACKCGCGFQSMKPSFVEKLDYARGRANVPFVVNSGARCTAHNASEDVGGKENSEHLANGEGFAEGVDISTPTSHVRWKVVTGALAAGIRRIGIGDDFVHLGDGLSHKPHPVMWVY